MCMNKNYMWNPNEYDRIFCPVSLPHPRPLSYHHCCPELVSPARCPNKCYVSGAYVIKHGKCLAHPLSYPVACHHQFERLWIQLNLPSLPPGYWFLWTQWKSSLDSNDQCYGSLWALLVNEWIINTGLPLSLWTKAARSAAVIVHVRETKTDRNNSLISSECVCVKHNFRAQH